jgi:hypothetical protein
MSPVTASDKQPQILSWPNRAKNANGLAPSKLFKDPWRPQFQPFFTITRNCSARSPGNSRNCAETDKAHAGIAFMQIRPAGTQSFSR